MKQVKGYLTRKSMLYKTGVEYGDYSMNHVLGCSHGCLYPCYAFMMKRRFGQVKDYETWIEPYLVSNTLELLEKEIPKLKGNIRSVNLSFATDSFMYGYPEIARMSMDAIAMLNRAGIKCTVLTKGVLPAELSSLSRENEYGITITSLNDEYRKRMEPGSAPITERLSGLKRLHDLGCRTFVSVEPFPTPNIEIVNLQELLEIVGFVDKIIFGRMNYSVNASSFKMHREFYNEKAEEVVAFCRAKGISYHIKDGTITNA